MHTGSTTRSTALPLIAALAVAALALGACGGDDDDSPTPGATTSAATGATVPEPGEAAYEITAQQYLAAPIPDQIKAMKEFVADNPTECAGKDATDGGNFPQGVGVAAASGDGDVPMSEIILAECTEGD